MRLFSRRGDGQVSRFSRLLIQPSGVADPAPIMQAILRNPIMSRALRLEAVVTTVDVVHAAGQLARLAEARKQVGLADCLVLTKTDLATPAQIDAVEALLRRLNPVAPILHAVMGGLDPALMLPPSFLDLASVEPEMPRVSPRFADAGEASHNGQILAVAVTAD